MDKRIPTVVPSLNEIKKMIKQESMSSGRLTSLRLPKDLNLGGTKPKKIYTPNLNVVRNKDKQNVSAPKTARYQKTPTHKRRSVNNLDKNKKPKYVQSEGVFSQGIGEGKSSHQTERAQSSKEYNQLTMPKINKNTMIKNRNYNPVIYDDSDSDSDNEYEPIILPLSCNKESFSSKFSIKSEPSVKIKMEEPDDENNPKPSKSTIDYDKTKVKIEKVEADSTTKKAAFLDETTEYDDDNPVFSLIRLPNTFFGKVWADDGKETNLDYSLKCLPEGHIGKICIHKSGKIDFLSQNFKFDLQVEESDGFSKMAVQFPGKESIAIEPSLVTLGAVTEKLVVTPEWNTLFDCAKRKYKFYW